ncbi:MAG: hypothetical protein HFI87_06995 [Bacilli bacterium]|nr:hypothetical protein [Bacilli bacterium]
MPEWDDPKFKPLLTSNIWRSNYNEISKILKMDEWNDPKFKPLLTSNIWHSNYDEISKILKMPEWDDSKFTPLLTSSIWLSNCFNIRRKLNLKYWDNPKYSKLLTPTIFSITEKYINGNIELFEEYGISKFIATNSLRKNPDEQKALFDYLIENKIDFLIDNKLNPIINATKKALKEKYNININEIMNNNKRGKVYEKF